MGTGVLIDWYTYLDLPFSAEATACAGPANVTHDKLADLIMKGMFC